MSKSFPTVFIGALFLPLNILSGQVINQDDKGFSSIFLPAATINIDGANNLISLSYAKFINEKNSYLNYTGFNIDTSFETYYRNSPEKKIQTVKSWADKFRKNNKKTIGTDFLIGASFSGQSSNGLSIFLAEGLLASQSSAQGTIGLQITKKTYDKKWIEEYAVNRYNYGESLMKREELEKKITECLTILSLMDYFPKDRFKILQSRLDKVADKDLLKAVKLTLQEFKEGDSKTSNTAKKDELDKLIKDLEEIEQEVDFTISLIEADLKVSDSTKGTRATASLLSLPNKALKEVLVQRDKVSLLLQLITKEYSKTFQFDITSDISKNFALKNWKELQKSLTENLKILQIRLSSFDTFYRLPGQKEYKNLQTHLVAYAKELDSMVEYQKDMRKIQTKQLDYNKHIFYGRLGFSESAFRYDLDNEATLLADRVEKRQFQGNRVELGYTHQLKTYNYFGLNIAKEFKDNSHTLTETEVGFKTIDTSVEPNLEVSNTIKVLSGEYDKFDEYQISFDYARMIPLREMVLPEEKEKTTVLYININPYIRHRFYANASNLSPDFSVGLGLYTFNISKNSIAGGAFIQANDIFNQNRTESLQFTKQLSIGLVFKYAIKSFNPKE